MKKMFLVFSVMIIILVGAAWAVAADYPVCITNVDAYTNEITVTVDLAVDAGTVFVAVYDTGGKILAFPRPQKLQGDKEYVFYGSFDIGAEVKAFVWEGLESGKPFAEVKTAKVTEKLIDYEHRPVFVVTKMAFTDMEGFEVSHTGSMQVDKPLVFDWNLVSYISRGSILRYRTNAAGEVNEFENLWSRYDYYIKDEGSGEYDTGFRAIYGYVGEMDVTGETVDRIRMNAASNSYFDIGGEDFSGANFLIRRGLIPSWEVVAKDSMLEYVSAEYVGASGATNLFIYMANGKVRLVVKFEI